MKTFDEVFNEIKSNVSVSKSGKPKKTFSITDFTEATNSALASFSYYDLRAKRYARTKAKPVKLTFVSADKASTENTKVSVTGEPAASTDSSGNGADSSMTLRFAPNANSPIVITLPPGTEIRETCRWNGWRRVESARGAGWLR